MISQNNLWYHKINYEFVILQNKGFVVKHLICSAFRLSNHTMADRYNGININDSGDSEQLVINYQDYDDKQQPANEAIVDVTGHTQNATADNEESSMNSCSIIQIEIIQPESENDSIPDEQPDNEPQDHTMADNFESLDNSCSSWKPLKPTAKAVETSPSFLVKNLLPSSSNSAASQQLPGISSIMSKPNDSQSSTASTPTYLYQQPLSFWDTPEYNYTMDTDLYHQDLYQYQQEMVAKASKHLQSLVSCDSPQSTTEDSTTESQRSDQNVESLDTNSPTLTQTMQRIEENLKTSEPKTTKQDNRKIAGIQSAERKEYKRYPKPPYSYAAMCIMAIENSVTKALQYREINKVLRGMFPAFFNGDYQGWQRSVRHVLSRMDCFYHEQAYDGSKNCFIWKVDLSKVKPEWFKRQDKKDELKATKHEYKLYLHEELDVPPIILPEKHCVTETAADEAKYSRAIRAVLALQQHKKPTDTEKQASELEELKVNEPDISTDLQNTTESGSTGVVLPLKPSNYNSLSTLVTDTDDFLGAKINPRRNSSADSLPESTDSSSKESTANDDDIKNFGLPTNLLDVSAQSPIPHDVYRDTEGLERYCPSVDSSASVSTGRTSIPASIQQPVLSKSRKRNLASEGSNPSKKAKVSSVQQERELPVTVSDYMPQRATMSSVFPNVASSQGASLTSVPYSVMDPLQQYLTAYSTSFLPASYEADKSPLCWPPVENNGTSLSTAETFPWYPFGYPTQQNAWQYTGYPYSLPVSYGYPTYESQYGGIDTRAGYQQFPNEASRWYRFPYEDPLNLCKK